MASADRPVILWFRRELRPGDNPTVEWEGALIRYGCLQVGKGEAGGGENSPGYTAGVHLHRLEERWMTNSWLRTAAG